MAQVSRVWLEAQSEIEEFKKKFEKKYGFGLMIYIRNSKYIDLPPVSLEDILEETNRIFFDLYPSKIVDCSYGKVDVTEGIKTKTRIHEVLAMRHIFCYIALEFGYAYTEIGRFLGMNHSTIIAAKKSLESSFKTNYRKSYDKYKAVKASILIKFSEVL
jgi:hypothetical protein